MKRGVATKILIGILCIELMASGAAFGAQGAIGHYSPGAMASFIDTAPPGLAFMNIFNYYDGSAEHGRTLPFGGLLAADLNATLYAECLVVAYTSPFGILDGKFAFGIMLPYVWADVKGTVIGPRGRTISRKDTASGFGDLMFAPVNLTWNKGDFKWGVGLDIYAPTGEYEVGKLANVGLNYWTFEPRVSFSYLSKTIGLEVTTSLALDFNTTNNATDYRSGDVFHWDVTVAEHLPLFSKDNGIIGLGVNAFYWRQITGDSGSGAKLGAFMGETVGIGPVLSYISPPICGHTIAAEVKWLPELRVDNRLRGDYVWFKLAWAF